MQRRPRARGEATLTPRQVEILRIIRDSRRRNGYSPTLQEMADLLGISKVTVFEHVEALIKKRLLLRKSNRARSLELSASVQLPDERPGLLPLVGTIAAGHPIEAIEDADAIDVEQLFSSSRYPVRALRVKGDSMIDEQIREGDLVIYEERHDPRNGETVVALIDNEEATLKKFYREKGQVRLQPANPKYRPILVSDRELRIQGVVIGLIRRLAK